MQHPKLEKLKFGIRNWSFDELNKINIFKMGEITKRIQIFILDDKQSLISMIMSHYFYDLTHLRNIFIQFLVQMKTSKFAFEIN